MRVLITGSSGLVGTALRSHLARSGHEVVRLVRREASGADEVSWRPGRDEIDARGLDGVEAVVHLAGANIAAKRWTDERKALLRSSRIDATGLLCRALLESGAPRVFVQASAVGYYGDSGDAKLTESSPPGDDFLARLCVDWEAASEPLETAGCRVARMRLGVVLSAEGGALRKMLPAFRWGVGGRLGSGRQYMSWIALDDVVGAFDRALADDAIQGAHNTVAPNPVTNAEFTRTLGRVLSRPTILPVPAFALRAALGELADAALLASARAVPERLLEARFDFGHVELEPALRALLDRRT